VHRSFSTSKGIRRCGIEIEQAASILQHEASSRCHDSGTKLGVVALYERHHVPFSVHHAQVRRVAPRLYLSCRRIAICVIGVDPLGALHRPFLGEQCRHRQFLPSRIADILRQIRICQLLRLNHRVQRFRRPETPVFLSKRKRLHDIEHLQGRDSLDIGRQFVNGPIPVSRRNRFHPLTRVFGEIGCYHRPAVPLHRVQNLSRNLALVERIAPMLPNLLQRPCQVRIPENFSDSWRTVLQKIRACRRLIRPQMIYFRCPIRRRPLRHRKPVLRRANCRRQVIRQLLPSKFVSEFLPAVHGAGDGDRIYTLLRHAPDSLLLQIFNRQSLGRPSACIQSIKLVGLRVVDDRE